MAFVDECSKCPGKEKVCFCCWIEFSINVNYIMLVNNNNNNKYHAGFQILSTCTAFVLLQSIKTRLVKSSTKIVCLLCLSVMCLLHVFWVFIIIRLTNIYYYNFFFVSLYFYNYIISFFIHADISWSEICFSYINIGTQTSFY